jgi:hypothetical protein
MLYMVTFTINIPQMLAYIPAPWILWDIAFFGVIPLYRRSYTPFSDRPILKWNGIRRSWNQLDGFKAYLDMKPTYYEHGWAQPCLSAVTNNWPLQKRMGAPSTSNNDLSIFAIRFKGPNMIKSQTFCFWYAQFPPGWLPNFQPSPPFPFDSPKFGVSIGKTRPTLW